MPESQKTILFLPLNSAGHTNSSLAIADRFKKTYSCRTIFIMVGPPHGNEILNHGHELIELEEVDPYEDYEIEEGEDPSKLDEERKLREGKKKIKFDGAKRFPQIIARNQHMFMGTPEENFRNTTKLIGGNFHSSTIKNTPAVEEAIDRVKPDLIVSDTFMPPPTVLLNEGIRPWVRINSANPVVLTVPRRGVPKFPPNFGYTIYSHQERDRMRHEEPEKWQAVMDKWAAMNREMVAMWADSFKTMRAFYQSRGCDRLDFGKPMIDSPYLNIYLYPEALDYDQEEDLLYYPNRLVRCNSLVRHPAGELEKDELSYWDKQLAKRKRGKKVIFFSLGSIASGNIKLMQRYMDMLGEDTSEDRLYVVSKGVNGDKLKMNDRNMIGGNYVPQPFLLQSADLAIIHGGNNSITECMHYGLPMIVLPNFYDQFDNAQRIDDLKLGKRLNIHKCSKEELLGAVESLLGNSRLIDYMRDISKRMQARDEVGILVEVLQILAEQKALDEKLAAELNLKLDLSDGSGGEEPGG